MDLPERRRRERLVLESPESCLRRRAELGDEDVANALVRHRRDARLDDGEPVEGLGREEIRPHRKHLHELHEGAAELGRPGDDPLRVPDVRGEEGLVRLLARLERALEDLPEVAAADEDE